MVPGVTRPQSVQATCIIKLSSMLEAADMLSARADIIFSI